MTPDFSITAQAKRIEARAKVEKLQAEMKAMPQAECPVRHFFAPGVYIREMTIPAGVCIVGAVHKTKHANIISQGKCAVHCGDESFEFSAPYTFISESGAKKVVYAYSDVIWTTIHPTDETDMEKLTEELTESTYMELLDYQFLLKGKS